VRRLVALALLAVCLPASPVVAFPDRPLELTVLFGAGSAADLLARKLAELAGQRLGQPVAVVNRTGAGGALGYTHVKGQSPDGYALVWNSNSVSTAYHAGNMKFDHTAFAGVAALTSEPVSLAVKADAPWYLMPGVLVLCAVAAYSDNNNPFDVWVMVGAGILGYAMRGLGYDSAPLVLGLVLGPLLERSLLQALTIGRGDVRELWSSAPAAIMLVAAAVAFVAPALRACLRRWTRGRRPAPIE
jgi:hypothetical protein